MIIKLYSILVLLMFSGIVNAYTVFTDKTAWEDALSEAVIITEDFEDEGMAPGLDSYTIPLPYGTSSTFHDFNLIPSTSSNPTFSDTQVFQELVGGTTPRSVVWNFSSPFIAFGGNWDLSPANLGTGLAIRINGVIQTPSISTSHVDGGFWGLVAEDEDLPFLTVEVLRPTGTTGSELFHLDDMVYASIVTLPAALWLLGSAFIGLLGYKKRFSQN